jgi:hypothetical protein
MEKESNPSHPFHSLVTSRLKYFAYAFIISHMRATYRPLSIHINLIMPKICVELFPFPLTPRRSKYFHIYFVLIYSQSLFFSETSFTEETMWKVVRTTECVSMLFPRHFHSRRLSLL